MLKKTISDDSLPRRRVAPPCHALMMSLDARRHVAQAVSSLIYHGLVDERGQSPSPHRVASIASKPREFRVEFTPSAPSIFSAAVPGAYGHHYTADQRACSRQRSAASARCRRGRPVLAPPGHDAAVLSARCRASAGHCHSGRDARPGLRLRLLSLRSARCRVR